MRKRDSGKIVIEGHPLRSSRDSKQEINDECLVLENKNNRKKIITNFKGGRSSGCTNRRYISFNYDHERITPAFLYENKTIPRHRYEDQYKEKLRNAKFPKNKTPKLPGPREKREKDMYCGVCRKSYDNYHEHVRSSAHNEIIQSDPYTKYMYKFEKFYVDLAKRRAKQDQKEQAKRF